MNSSAANRRIAIPCIILILLSFSIHAQIDTQRGSQTDYNEFNKILLKETSANTADTGGIKVLRPASLPGWMCRFPGSNPRQLYALGISDPGMDETEGFQVACLRAKAMIALLQHPRVAGMTDNFSNEKSESRTDEFITKYENLYNIASSVIMPNFNFKVINRHFTSFGESVVLMAYTPGETEAETDTMTVNATAYEVERQKINLFESEDRYEIAATCTHRTDSNALTTFRYTFKSLNNLVEIESVVGTGSHKFPYAIFRYSVADDTLDLPDRDFTYQKLNYGLWKTYFQSVIQQIALLSQPLSGNLKLVSDDYSRKNQNLSREISDSSPSFHLKEIRIKNNCMAVDMDYLNQTY